MGPSGSILKLILLRLIIPGSKAQKRTSRGHLVDLFQENSKKRKDLAEIFG